MQVSTVQGLPSSQSIALQAAMGAGSRVVEVVEAAIVVLVTVVVLVMVVVVVVGLAIVVLVVVG